MPSGLGGCGRLDHLFGTKAKPKHEPSMKEEGPIKANTSNPVEDSSGDALSSKIDDIPSTASLSSPYLSKPSRETAETPQRPIAATEFAPSSRKDRLYIGNIHHTVDECVIF
jgi:hypothetical protein